jgi:hypothetical protein
MTYFVKYLEAIKGLLGLNGIWDSSKPTLHLTEEEAETMSDSNQDDTCKDGTAN